MLGSGDSYEVNQSRQQVMNAKKKMFFNKLKHRSFICQKTRTQVMDSRDALARSLYEKMFQHLVATINRCVSV